MKNEIFYDFTNFFRDKTIFFFLFFSLYQKVKLFSTLSKSEIIFHFQ